MVNRAALLVRYKEPMIRWINESDSTDGPPITQAATETERTVYLISDEAAESPKATENWIRFHFADIFESELSGWYTEPDLWPKRRTFRLFQDWFEVEVHSGVYDLVGTQIIEDDNWLA